MVLHHDDKGGRDCYFLPREHGGGRSVTLHSARQCRWERVRRVRECGTDSELMPYHNMLFDYLEEGYTGVLLQHITASRTSGIDVGCVHVYLSTKTR